MGLRTEIALFLNDKTDLAKSLYNEEFILKLTNLADIFSKLNELHLYIQVTERAYIFAVHDKIRGFMKILTLWQKNIEKRKYNCFETFQTFIAKNDFKVFIYIYIYNNKPNHFTFDFVER